MTCVQYDSLEDRFLPAFICADCGRSMADCLNDRLVDQDLPPITTLNAREEYL